MAIVKDLIVLGSTRQIGPAYAGTIYAESFVKNGSGNEDILLGDGSTIEIHDIYLHCDHKYVTSLGTNNTYLTWTKNGTTNNLTVPYATNAGSADKLINARTIWGQSFNGTANVTGNMSSVGNVTPTANNTYANGSSSNNWSVVNTRNVRSNSTLYLGSADATSVLFTINDSEVARFCQPYGYLGIGVTAPKQKLHVAGNAKFEGGFGSKGTQGTVEGAFIAHPGGGCYATGDSTKTGYLKITLPQIGKNTIMSFDVTIYTHSGNNQSYVTYHISGYEHGSNGWSNSTTKVYSEGVGTYANLTVRLGTDGTKACVTIGEESTSWSYPQVTIHNIMTGYSNSSIDTWIKDWTIEFTTTALTTIVSTKENVNTQNINILGNAETATSAGSATSATNATNADKVKTVTSSSTNNHYLTFVDSNNSSSTEESIYTTSKLYIKPSTGDVYSSGRVYVNNTTASFGASSAANVWIANSSGYPIVADANVVRRGANMNNGQLGDNTYPWAKTYTTTWYTANYEVKEYSSRIAFGSHGQTTAKGINIGDLLVSNSWSDSIKVPINGIYSKGNIKCDSRIESGVTSGISPFVIASDTLNTNLNADLLDNLHAADLLSDVSLYSGGNSTKIDITVGGTTLTSSMIVPYASNAGSVNWANIINVPQTFTPTEHYHDDRYVTALGTSLNYVTWTKNGTTYNLTVPYATNAGTASKVIINTSLANATYNIVFNSGSTLCSDSDIQLNPSTGEVTAKRFAVTHANGGGNEFRVKYSTTVDMAMMIGSENTNHGLYDIKNSKWMIVADQSGNVTVNGNATTATTLATTRTLWGQNFNGSANVTGDMTSVGSISASGNIITEKSDTTAVRVSTKNSNGEIAIYTSANRGLYDFTSGKWLIAYNSASTYTFLGVGDVGIGCAPTVKLDVNGQIRSRSATGTAPLVVSSTTKVTNLNADLLDGEHNYNLRSIPDNGGDVLFSILPYIDSRINPFNKVVDIDVAPGDAPFGYCFGPIVNYSTFVSTYISVTPGDKIRGEVYAYRDSEATATNNGVLFCGISRYDRNKKPISSNSGNQYFVASNSTVPSDGVWHKYSATVTIPTEHTIYNGSDGGGVYYIKVVLYVDYNKNDCIPTYIGGLQFTKLLDNNYTNYLPLAGGTMTGAISRNYTAASDVPVINVASTNKDVWLWRVRTADSGTSSSVDKVYGFGAKYLGTGTGNDNSWAMYSDNQNGTQIKALEMKQSGDLFAYAPIHWANSTALPEDTSPQYILTTDSFANGGKTKWTSKANLATSIGLDNYLPLSGGTITGNLAVNGNTTLGDANADNVTIKAKNINFNNTTSIEFDNLAALWGEL